MASSAEWLGVLLQTKQLWVQVTLQSLKTNPTDFNASAYIDTDFDVKNNYKNSKFKTDNHVRISKYNNIFGKAYTPSWS